LGTFLSFIHQNEVLNIRSVDRNKYQIQIPLPPKIDASVTMMQVEEKPDVTYSDVGGCKEQIEKLREVVETPLLHVCAYLIIVVER
jgi:26S proteasome regulatory subunit T1